jgi:polyhydroxyalkanoate synthesis repressor PhaR
MHRLQGSEGNAMAKASKSGGDNTIVTIKKYANRRLYNTESSAYITLETLAKMVRDGREFEVLDAKTGDDITHNVLTQIIMEGEGKAGQSMLPAGFLRQIISMYGDSMQSMVPGYLEASMEAFRRNQEQVKSTFEGVLANSPFGEIAKRNMAMFEAATSAFRPAKTESAVAPLGDGDVAELKAELAALQAKISKLVG